MAGKKLSWIFEIFDKMSTPARRIERSLERVEKKLDKMSPEAGKAERAITKLGQTAKKSGDGFGWMGLKIAGWVTSIRAGIAAVTTLGSAIGRVVFGGVKAGIGAASFKESTMLGLTQMLRSPGLATGVYNEAVNFADISPYDTQDTLRWYRMLIGAGVGTKGLGSKGGSNVLKVLAGLGDIAAQQANPNEAMDRIIIQVMQMLSKGRLQGEELTVLAEAGVNSGAVYRQISKIMGVPAAQLQSSKYQGKIPANVALAALLRYSQETFGGGQLGGGMGPASRTFQGLWSTLQSRPYRMMEDLGKTQGFQSMKKALSNLVDALDPSTPTGSRVKKNIEETFDRLLGGIFKQFEDPRKVEEFINGLLAGLEKIKPVVSGISDSFKEMAGAAGKLSTFFDTFGPKDPTTGKTTFRKGTELEGLLQQRELLRYFENMGGLELYMRTGKTRSDLNARIAQVDAAIRTEQQKTGPAAAPPAVTVQPGGVVVNVNGVADPAANGEAVSDALTSWLENLRNGTVGAPAPAGGG